MAIRLTIQIINYEIDSVMIKIKKNPQIYLNFVNNLCEFFNYYYLTISPFVLEGQPDNDKNMG